MLVHVLLVMDPAADRKRIERLLSSREVVLTAASGKSGLSEQLAGSDVDFVIVDRNSLPTHPEPLIRSIRTLPDRPEIVILTEKEDPSERASLLTAGCLGVLHRDLGEPVLRGALEAMLDRRRNDAMNRLRADRPEEHYSLGDFVSESPAMQMFLDLARRVVLADSSVLILGETGVGKERLARAIHQEGPRSRGPFMAVNCGALPEGLLESELFGHEEGAFTGASRSRKGYFELAHRGTIFLDEIGEMPLHLQVKLLRVLDEHRIQRVGGESAIDVNVRILAATNRDLEADVVEKRFRSDLFYRLAVVTLEIPPLRDRREDIPHLVQSYLEHFANQTGRPVASVSAKALEAMARYDWPGNVRELINAVERAVLLAPGEEITTRDLPGRIGSGGGPARRAGESGRAESRGGFPADLTDRPLVEAKASVVRAFEARYVDALLASSRGRVGEAARRAGINPRTLYDLMKRHGLRKEDYKPG